MWNNLKRLPGVLFASLSISFDCGDSLTFNCFVACQTLAWVPTEKKIQSIRLFYGERERERDCLLNNKISWQNIDFDLKLTKCFHDYSIRQISIIIYECFVPNKNAEMFYVQCLVLFQQLIETNNILAFYHNLSSVFQNNFESNEIAGILLIIFRGYRLQHGWPMTISIIFATRFL